MATETTIQERMNIVIVGHVDHGKSTLLGRLYADTGTLPEGKIEKVQAICRQQGKEFEYAFLFDAFLEEQQQGITIDTARTFFTWAEMFGRLGEATLPGHRDESQQLPDFHNPISCRQASCSNDENHS